MTELRLETYNMPAADLGIDNPLPPLKNGRDLHTDFEPPAGVPDDMRRNFKFGHLPNIMPYAMQDGYGRETQPRDFRVAVLENEILRATFLLELGGRLWSLFHKPTLRELLSVNPVFQPANLALRNAWFSGGVEWNIGTIGHSPFTCAPFHAARIETQDGTPVLRMYEWERIRQTPFQIDAWLPDDSPVLFVRICIINPHDQAVPMYWWSTIAVPETPETRVLIPAESAYRFNYSGLDIKSVPEMDGLDITYPTNIPYSADYFFHVDNDRYPWITALDGEGKGLMQTSTQRLKGRKLFVWGMGQGGRRWQEFLSPGGEPYIEIQAGLARTQLEHIPMPPGEWAWLEAYGLLEAAPDAVHGTDWTQAQQAVETSLDHLIPRAELEAEFARSANFAGLPPVEIIQHGSGWGALERHQREKIGEKPFCVDNLIFDDSTMGAAQTPWLTLLHEGRFPEMPPDQPPAGFIVQSEWRALLEAAVVQPHSVNWFAWYHLGIMRAYANDREGALQAWKQSLQLAATPWAMRNLALFTLEDGRNNEEAVSLYIDSARMQPELIPLAVECGQALLQVGQPQQWLDLLNEMPETIRKVGRIQLLETQAALAVDDFERLGQFFADEVIILDLREGEGSLSDLWFEYQIKRLSSQEKIQIDDDLRERVYREFPVPAHLDFRMKIEPFEQE